MHHLASGAERRTIQLAARPNGTAAAAVRARPHMGKRPDGDVRIERGPADHRGEDAAAVADRAVADDGVRAQDAAPPDRGLAAEVGVGQDQAVLADVDAGVDVGRSGVLQGDAGVQQPADDAAPQDALRLGQLQPRVDPEHLLHVGHAQGGHRLAPGGRRRRQGGQVHLTVRRRTHLGQAPPEPGGVESAEAAVDLPDAALRRRGVALLDDGPDGPAGPALPDDAPVAARIVQLAGDQGQGCALPRVAVEHQTHRLRLQQGGIAVGHEQRLRPRPDRFPGDEHGVAGAELGLLQDEAVSAGAEVPFHRLAHAVGAVSDHDDGGVGVDPGAAQGHQDVPQHRPSGDVVQHLVALGAHPGALAGGQDNGGGSLPVAGGRRSRPAGVGVLTVLGHQRRTARGAAGALGFEPRIQAPKARALPLGHAPSEETVPTPANGCQRRARRRAQMVASAPKPVSRASTPAPRPARKRS